MSQELRLNRNIVRDLLPVYLAGDASTDTRALVESFLAQDPELRAEVEAARGEVLPGSAAVRPADALESRALARTQTLLRRRSLLMGIAGALTVVPFTFLFRRNEIQFLMYRDWPIVAMVAMGAAILTWIGFFRVCAQLAATGLEPPLKKTLPMLWAAATYLVVTLLLIPVLDWTGLDWRWMQAGPIVASGLVGWLAVKLRQVPTPEDLHRPQGLFDRER